MYKLNEEITKKVVKSQSPLTGQFNFYLQAVWSAFFESYEWSQSPLTGQFNFYYKVFKSLKGKFIEPKTETPETE